MVFKQAYATDVVVVPAVYVYDGTSSAKFLEMHLFTIVWAAVPTFVVIEPQHPLDKSPHAAVSLATVQNLDLAFQMLMLGIWATVNPRKSVEMMAAFILLWTVIEI